MTFLSVKMLFMKQGTLSAILAVALLAAIPASLNSIVNDTNSQTEALAGIVDIGGVYLILERNSTSITDSRVEPELTNPLKNVSDVEYVFPQKVSVGTLTVKSTNYTVTIRAVENVQLFLYIRHAHLRGYIASADNLEVNLGEIIARIASVDIDEEVTLTIGCNSVRVRVVGIVETSTPSDAELIVPMKIIDGLIGESDRLSFIEFSLRRADSESDVESRIKAFLPQNVKVVKAQQLKSFVQSINKQILSFLELWSSLVFMTMVAASYIVATRLVTEAGYEMAILRALGSQRKMLFAFVSAYTTIVALVGAILGLSIGVVGVQVASTVAGWIRPSIGLAPLLEIEQALGIVILTVASSLLGCLCPASRFAFKVKMEQML